MSVDLKADVVCLCICTVPAYLIACIHEFKTILEINTPSLFLCNSAKSSQDRGPRGTLAGKRSLAIIKL